MKEAKLIDKLDENVNESRETKLRIAQASVFPSLSPIYFSETENQ